MKFTISYPIKPLHINQPFGVNGAYYQSLGVNIAGHNGIDFMASRGEPVFAAHDGLYFYETDIKQGHGVVLKTLTQFDYNDSVAYFKTIYWHFIDNRLFPDNTFVRKGTIIGYADNTGLSTGDHLHFGLKPMAIGEDNLAYNLEQNNGYMGCVDPTPYFDSEYAMTAQEGLLTTIYFFLSGLKMLGTFNPDIAIALIKKAFGK